MDARSFAESVTPAHAETRDVERRRQRQLPMLLTIDETADLLRTTRRAVYAMVERRQLPGVVRVRRRVLVRSQELLDWLDQKSALSLKEYKR
jgi:excisionase family DNA binding protein